MRSVEDDVSAVKDGVKAVEEEMHLYRQASQVILRKQWKITPASTKTDEELWVWFPRLILRERRERPWYKELRGISAYTSGVLGIFEYDCRGPETTLSFPCCDHARLGSVLPIRRVLSRRLHRRRWQTLVASSGSASSTKSRFPKTTSSSRPTCWAREASARCTWPTTTATTRRRR